MPIQPPRLDDRSYDDILREARALIPQYCPEWTHLGDSDPGMTLVQLFAWMTEMTLYRLNRVPDKTYLHFLAFIGEERRAATPARVPITFGLRSPGADPVELPAHVCTSTRQRSGAEALHFLTTGPVTVHGASVDRLVAVAAGPHPRVREVPFERHPAVPRAVVLDGGQGVQVFELDPVAHGPRSWTADQLVYVRHDQLQRLAAADAPPRGALRLRSAGEPGLPIAALFDWDHPGEDGAWVPVTTHAEGEVRGLPEVLLCAGLAGLQPLSHLGRSDAPLPLPPDLPPHGWIRGRVAWERWLAARMEDELRITWRDDRGGDERELTHWYVRDVGRTLELFVQNLPPIRAGWTVRLTLVDHGLRAGHDGILPRYRWSWRRGDRWLPVPDDRVAQVGAAFVLTGPFPDLASDGYNLRAVRVETLDLEGVLPGLRAELVWQRPVEVHLAAGPEADAASVVRRTELPCEPFQPAPGLPALLGMKLFLGSDLLGHRSARLRLELEVAFERDGEPVEEPVDAYYLQLTHRTASGWQVVGHEAVDLARFRLADLDPEGAGKPGAHRLRLLLDPRTQLEGLTRSVIAGEETCWLRLELTRAALSWRKDDRSPPVPVSLRLLDVQLGLEEDPAASTWEEVLPGTRVLTLEQRPEVPRFTCLGERRGGRVVQTLPLDPVLEVDDAEGGHHALYLRLDRPLPAGQRLVIAFRCRGEAWLPAGAHVHWELLQAGPGGGRRWTRLGSTQDPGGTCTLERSGVLAFSLDAPVLPADDGVWLRAIHRAEGGATPVLPPLTHVLPDTVEAVNLHAFHTERFSGLGVPGQVLQLQHFPVHLPPPGGPRDPLTEVHVEVEEDHGQRHRWRLADGQTLTTAGKDDRVFVVDPVEGTLTFGNGIRGRVLPVGSFNVTVTGYHAVPGAAGNVGPGEVCVPQGEQVTAANVVPAIGGRDAESIDEIIRRAPSVLTSRDRAVTRGDFEVIAAEASSEVARAACLGDVDDEGGIEVVVLPRCRPGEALPDPFLSPGLKDRVADWLGRRCLVNVRPRVRLATFLAVDVSLDLRLRPGANRVQVRERVTAWVRRFLDPYGGGLEGAGWPFGGALYAQDFGRLVTDVPDVRHVVDVAVHPAAGLGAPTPADARAPAWASTPGMQVLHLRGADLFHARHVRVRWAEEVA